MGSESEGWGVRVRGGSESEGWGVRVRMRVIGRGK